MTIDLLSLALAAAIPIAVFGVHTWLRAKLDGRARRPQGALRNSGSNRSIAGPPVSSWPVDGGRQATPGVTKIRMPRSRVEGLHERGQRLFEALRAPLRTVAKRGVTRPEMVEAEWPVPDLANDPFRRIDYWRTEASDACPACAESQDRGAAFCQRCGRSLASSTKP